MDMFAAAEAMFEKRRTAARIIWASNLSNVRAKLGKIETSLTPEIGHAEGVSKYSVKEIMYVYGVNRSTAYRWKQFDCHPWSEPKLDSSQKIRWTDLPKIGAAKERRTPYHRRLEIICQARSAVRHAVNQLRKLEDDSRYHYPFDKECEKAADELHDALDDIYGMIWRDLDDDE